MPLTTFDADYKRHVGVRWRGWFDSRGRFQLPWETLSWRTWRPPPCPNLDGVLWTDAPWHQPVAGLAVDLEATALLHSPEWDAPVRTGVGGVSSGNVWGGSPWQDVTGMPMCTVWETGEAQGADLMPWVWQRHEVPLPPVVRRYDDPTGSQDVQWVGIDFERRLMWECGAMRPRPGTSDWVARGVTVWDLDAPWDAGRGGCTATWLPLVAGIPRAEEFARGHIDHALWFVADRYRTGEVRWPARATDGNFDGAPLVAGMRLALDPAWRPSKLLTRDQLTLVRAMRHDTGFGFIVADRTHPEHGSTMRDAMDPRVMLADLGIHHHDLLILRS